MREAGQQGVHMGGVGPASGWSARGLASPSSARLGWRSPGGWPRMKAMP